MLAVWVGRVWKKSVLQKTAENYSTERASHDLAFCFGIWYSNSGMER